MLRSLKKRNPPPLIKLKKLGSVPCSCLEQQLTFDKFWVDFKKEVINTVVLKVSDLIG